MAPKPGPTPQDIGSDLFKIIKLIKERKYDPVIVFSFSRRETELYARLMVQGMPSAGKPTLGLCFNTDEEKAMVEDVFTSAVSGLSEADRNLSAIQGILPLLKAGVAMHHSGLLPILKEVVEILFQEHLIKCLFATETFAMGVNMPAKTVVFTAMRKYDGESHRWMGSGEYIQMSGRAGRRGKDDRGLIIMMVEEAMDADVCKSIVTGKPSPLNSSFKLSYYTLLNLLRRVEDSGHDMEYVIAHSFQQFQFERSLPEKEENVHKIEREAADIDVATEEHMKSYIKLRKAIEQQRRVIQANIVRPERCMAFLKPGRLVQVSVAGKDWGTGVVVAVCRKPPGGMHGKPAGGSAADAYVVDTLLECAAVDGSQGGQPQPVQKGQQGEMHVVPVPLQLVTAISSLRISVVPDLRPPEARRATLLTLKAALKRYPDGIPLLDPVEDMGIEDDKLTAAVRAVEGLELQLAKDPVYQAENREGEAGEKVQKKAELLSQAQLIRASMAESQLHNFRTESKNRTAVLRKLGHINEDGVVTLKGRAACELDTADELLSSELLLNGVFSALDIHQLPALASTLIPQEKSTDQIYLKKDLADPLAHLQQAARKIAQVQAECKLPVDEDQYTDSFRPGLMDVVHAWSKGADFNSVCEMTVMFEGSIIRACRRLDELLSQLSLAAHVIGDEDLSLKIKDSVTSMRRDIMFAASLYI